LIGNPQGLLPAEGLDQNSKFEIENAKFYFGEMRT
jgi:hypothetical protein